MKNKQIFSLITTMIMMLSLCSLFSTGNTMTMNVYAAYENTHTNTGNQREDIKRRLVTMRVQTMIPNITVGMEKSVVIR